MKKIVLVFSFFMLAYFSHGQSLQSIIQMSNGISKSFVALKADQQITFNASDRDRLIGLEAPADLRLIDRFTDEWGYAHFKYQQTWKGIPIEAAIYSFHTRNSQLIAVNGQIILDVKQISQQSDKPTIVASSAIQKAMTESKAAKFAWQDVEMEKRIKLQKGDNSASYKPEAKLVWYCTAESLDPSAMRLAYKINIYSIEPIWNADYFIDAQTGALLGKDDKIHFSDAVGTAQTAYSGTQSIHSDFTGSEYHLRDYTKGNGVITLHGETGQKGNDYINSSANWSFASSDQAALDAHYGVSQSWQFYKDVFGRNSYDGNGAAIYSYVNVPDYVDDAYWDGTAINFCKRSTGEPGGVTAIDVAGHELTHGLIEQTSALKYKKEAGGINESLSDIMGKTIQFYARPTDISWVISNDMNWAIRNMADPKQFQQPDTYKGTFWKSNADVHVLSGVGNYMYYLLTDGGSGTNDRGYSYTVNGIGIEKARAIIYRSNLLYLTPNSTYYDWRLACEQAAIDLYGNNNEYSQVVNAWNAVGVDSISNIYCYGPNSLFSDGDYPFKSLVTWQEWDNRADSFQLKWKETNLGTWNTINGITDTFYMLKNLQPATYYTVKIASVCPESIISEYQQEWSFNTKTIGGYCTPDWGNNDKNYINSVTLNNKTNISGRGNGNISYYENFVNIVFPLKKNDNYSMQVETKTIWTTPPNVTVSIYIDYNHNKILDDPGELVGRTTVIAGGTVNIPFTVPNTAKNGITRLRVIMEETFFAYNNPCRLINGESEDYSIFIKPTNSANFASPDRKLNEDINNELSITPNPVKNTATLNYLMNGNGKVEIRIMDYLGRQVKQVNLGNQLKGSHQLTISTEQLISGNYQVQVLKDGEMVGSLKMMVIK